MRCPVPADAIRSAGRNAFRTADRTAFRNATRMQTAMQTRPEETTYTTRMVLNALSSRSSTRDDRGILMIDSDAGRCAAEHPDKIATCTLPEPDADHGPNHAAAIRLRTRVVCHGMRVRPGLLLPNTPVDTTVVRIWPTTSVAEAHALLDDEIERGLRLQRQMRAEFDDAQRRAGVTPTRPGAVLPFVRRSPRDGVPIEARADAFVETGEQGPQMRLGPVEIRRVTPRGGEL